LKLLLLALSVLAGVAIGALGLPAAFLTGPLLVAATFSITNRPVIRFPLFLYRLAQSVIGVMLSFSITAKSLHTIAANWAPVIALVLAMLVLTTVIGIVLRRLTDLQPGTALLGTLPGGAGEMIAMSDSLGADVRLVTVMQYGRLLAILATISLVGHFAGASAGGGHPITRPPAVHLAEPLHYLISAIIALNRSSARYSFSDSSRYGDHSCGPGRLGRNHWGTGCSLAAGHSWDCLFSSRSADRFEL